MKVSCLSASAIALCSFVAMSAQAADKPGFYVGAEAGWSGANSTTNKDTNPSDPNAVYGAGNSARQSGDNAAVVGLLAGYRFNDMFRADVGVDYRTGYTLKGTPSQHPASTIQEDVANWSVMANAYFEPVSYAGFKPYVGAGLGAAINTTGNQKGLNTPGGNISGSGATYTDFAWQAMAGVSYSLTSAVALDLGYRYFDGGEFRTGNTTTFGSPTKGNLTANEVKLGVRYGF